MIVIDSTGEVYFDTPAVQAAVLGFGGEHAGFGDFTALVPDESGLDYRIWMVRYDGTRLGNAVAERYGFVGRPHLVSGTTVDLLVQALVEGGQQLIEEENDAANK